MTRYYYTDPLAAAWMAKHFGMKFCDKASHSVSADPSLWYMAERHYQAGPLFIHPDSLHLLEPQKHDLVDFGWIHPCGQSFHELTLLNKSFKAFCEKSTCDYDSHQIIQRRGKPFHWPEVEP